MGCASWGAVDLRPLVQRVLWSGWGEVLEFVECVFHVAWYWYVQLYGGVFPLQFYSAVYSPFPVLVNFKLFLE